MRSVARFLAHPATWILPALVLWFAEGLPDPIDMSFFMYLVFFLLGFAIVSDEVFAEAAERHRWRALSAGAIISAAYVAAWGWRDTLADPSWALAGVNVLGMLGVWCVIVGALGVGRRHLDHPSRALAYHAESSYPVYLLHQTVIVVVAFYLVRVPVAWPLQWLMLLTASVAITYALYEGIRRVGALRFCFGMRPKPPVATKPAEGSAS